MRTRKVGSIEYKEKSPRNTISVLKTFFRSKGLVIKENWNSVGKLSYSVVLHVEGTTITSNGKGVSRELALASGYGELAERLSFMLPYRVSPFHKDFYEEIYHNLTEDNNDNNRPIEFDEWLHSKDAERFYEQFVNEDLCVTQKEQGYKLFMTRWKSRKNGEKSFGLGSVFSRLTNGMTTEDKMVLPYAILDYYYGSNGMCAGNTREEALTQGICEIIERHVQQKIITGNYSQIYDITESCCKEYQFAQKLACLFKKTGLSIRILECDSFQNVPVISVIVNDRKGEYYISFGCHLDPIVAVERTLTELLQGYNMGTLGEAFVGEYSDCSPVSMVDMENYKNILRCGVGKYPLNFVQGSFETRVFRTNSSKKTNLECLQELVHAVEKEGFKVYYANGIFTGIETFHVIIIGMSEAENLLPPTKIRSEESSFAVSNIHGLNTGEVKKVIAKGEEFYANGSKSIAELLGLDKYCYLSGGNSNLDGIPANIFLALLSMKAEEWNKAKLYVQDYITELREDEASLDDIQYYVLVHNVLFKLGMGWTKEQIKESLPDVLAVDEVIKAVTDKDNLFSDIPVLSKEAVKHDNPGILKLYENERRILGDIMDGGLHENSVK